jgi:hypothetical protein
MAVSVKKITLWRSEIDNRPGALASVLEPLAGTGADLQVAMGYRFPGNATRAAIELAPVQGKKAATAARKAGLAPSGIPTLIVQGENRAGLGARLSRAMGDAGIDMAFLVAQVVGRKYAGIFGFDSEEDAARAAGVIKKVSAKKK